MDRIWAATPVAMVTDPSACTEEEEGGMGMAVNMVGSMGTGPSMGGPEDSQMVRQAEVRMCVCNAVPL